MSGPNQRAYESKHLANIRSYQKRLQRAYYNAIDKIFSKAINLQFNKATFKLADNPAFARIVDETLLEFNQEVNITILNGIKAEWELSGEKHINVIAAHFKGIDMAPEAIKIIVDPREAALNAFIARKTAGLNLSDRIWKYTNQFRAEIEQGLYVGVANGQSAASMATDQKQYLVNPDKLFRRVRDADGKLVLSKAAKQYKPGQGVYRSSFKNAMRMTRDITNDAYRESDNVRWDATPFVLGFEIKLSASHPKHDICDYLVGIYPTSFKWTKWHIQCICFAVAVLASDQAYNEWERALLAGEDHKYVFQNRVIKMPDNFTEYVKSNSGRFDHWKSKPSWLKSIN